MVIVTGHIFSVSIKTYAGNSRMSMQFRETTGNQNWKIRLGNSNAYSLLSLIYADDVTVKLPDRCNSKHIVVK